MALSSNFINAYTKFQEIIFSTDLVGKKIIEFGDGEFEFFEGLSASHIYNQSGEYTACVRECTDTAFIATNCVDITVTNFVKDQIQFTSYPLTAFTSVEDGIEFEVAVSSVCPPPIKIQLGVDGTISREGLKQNNCDPVHYFYGDNVTYDGEVMLQNPKNIKVNGITVGYHDTFCFGYYDDYNGLFNINANLLKTCDECSTISGILLPIIDPPSAAPPAPLTGSREIWWDGGDINDTVRVEYMGDTYAVNHLDFLPDGNAVNPAGFTQPKNFRKLVRNDNESGNDIMGEILVVHETEVSSLNFVGSDVDGGTPTFDINSIKDYNYDILSCGLVENFCYSLDGGACIEETTGAYTIQGQQQILIELYFYPRNLTPQQGLISFGGYTGALGGISLYLNNGTIIMGTGRGGGPGNIGATANTGQVVTQDRWNKLVVLWSGIEGELPTISVNDEIATIESGTFNGAPTATGQTVQWTGDSESNFTIGCYATFGYFDGFIANVKVEQGAETHYWGIEQSNGNIVYDHFSNDYPLTAMNGHWASCPYKPLNENNRVGYTRNNDVLIPRNEDNIVQDVLSGSLECSGATHPIGSACLNLGATGTLTDYQGSTNQAGRYTAIFGYTGSQVSPYKYKIGELESIYNPELNRWEIRDITQTTETLHGVLANGNNINPFGVYTNEGWGSNWTTLELNTGSCPLPSLICTALTGCLATSDTSNQTMITTQFIDGLILSGGDYKIEYLIAGESVGSYTATFDEWVISINDVVVGRQTSLQECDPTGSYTNLSSVDDYYTLSNGVCPEFLLPANGGATRGVALSGELIEIVDQVLSSDPISGGLFVETGVRDIILSGELIEIVDVVLSSDSISGGLFYETGLRDIILSGELIEIVDVVLSSAPISGETFYETGLRDIILSGEIVGNGL